MAPRKMAGTLPDLAIGPRASHLTSAPLTREEFCSQKGCPVAPRTSPSVPRWPLPRTGSPRPCCQTSCRGAPIDRWGPPVRLEIQVPCKKAPDTRRTEPKREFRGARRAVRGHNCGHIDSLARGGRAPPWTPRMVAGNGKGSAMQTPRNPETRQAIRRDVVKISGTHEGQREAWRSAADRNGLPLATWLREAADAAVLSGVTAADLRSEIQRLRADLTRGVGNNLNQVAQHLHLMAKGRSPADPVGVTALMRDVAREFLAIRKSADMLLRHVEPRRRRRR